MHVSINQQPYEFADGLTVLQALRAARIEVPTLCHDDRLKPAGDCRMCLVEIAGHSRLATACNTSLTEGMQIETDTLELIAERRALLQMYAQRYPAAAVRDFPDKPLHRYLNEAHLLTECLGDEDPQR
ncbi:MAG: 2Fe-2S iron-sulfur cluster binding domain-containing protein, partial [Acidobacteria bacterium]|nr:2Fe-2S iron-sulfur cluster binding domain-containing protein [Acidobacteriota bacterium]